MMGTIFLEVVIGGIKFITLKSIAITAQKQHHLTGFLVQMISQKAKKLASVKKSTNTGKESLMLRKNNHEWKFKIVK